MFLSRRAFLVIFSVLFCSFRSISADAPAKPPKTKPWDKLENVKFKGGRYDDGDSFHVIAEDGRELILRLYFVDTCEEEAVYADRIRDQAAYFGVTPERVKELGHEAAAFTRKQLEKPFTVWTRWHKALGRSKQDRYYATIITAGGKPLAEELVRNGLARIYGTRTVTHDTKSSSDYRSVLEKAEAAAKAAKSGGWRHQ